MVVVTAEDAFHADALAEQLGPHARAASVEDAIAEADAVFFALWHDGAAGFEPLKVGGVSDAGRIEGSDGELQGRILDLHEAQASIATEGVKA